MTFFFFFVHSRQMNYSERYISQLMENGFMTGFPQDEKMVSPNGIKAIEKEFVRVRERGGQHKYVTGLTG